MGNIQFVSFKRKSKFISPLKNFQEDVHLLEHRQDPLMGTMSILGYNLADKAKMLFGDIDHDLIEQVAQESKPRCFMCPEKVNTTTPKYSSDILPQERVNLGEATLFPNLFPLSEFHAVCALTHTHYLNLRDFSPEILANGIQACLKFVKSAFNANSSAKYMTLNCNYLFPAGASVVHPHMQVLGGDVPYTYLKSMLEDSLQYFEKNQSNFWNDLISAEKKARERYIGKTGEIEWIATFSPLGVNEVQGIIREKSNFLELSQTQVKALGEGISKILKFYEEEGYSTFNFVIYSGPMGETIDWFWSNMRIISRANVYKNYRTDDYFLQKLLGTEIILTPPEELADKLKVKF